MAGFVIFSLRTCHSSFPHTLCLMPVFPDHPNLKRKRAVPQAPVASPPHRQLCLCTSKKGEFSSRRGCSCSCLVISSLHGHWGSYRSAWSHKPAAGQSRALLREGRWAASLGGPAASPSPGPLSRGLGHGSRCFPFPEDR